ncbi:MAG: hypothetical protein D6730_13515 [Bacteroidetes bacterium]|nr:MAG: hypothetical protein D6730_13515 [Bacteroidota bacterium]
MVLEDVPMFGPVAAVSAIGTGLILIWVVVNRFPAQMGLAWLGAIVSLLGLLLLIFQKEKSQVVLDRERGELVIFRSRFLGKHTEKSYPLAEIQQFEVEIQEGKSRLLARTTDGRQLPFTHRYQRDTPANTAILRTINRFLGKSTQQ